MRIIVGLDQIGVLAEPAKTAVAWSDVLRSVYVTLPLSRQAALRFLAKSNESGVPRPVFESSGDHIQGVLVPA
jgi:hypothetical protein